MQRRQSRSGHSTVANHGAMLPKTIRLDFSFTASESSLEAESSRTNSPPTEFSDWDSFSDIPSFNSASDAFTDNYTDSELEGIDISWLYTTVKEQEEDTARKRYLRRRDRYIREIRILGLKSVDIQVKHSILQILQSIDML